jgi:hypothetical protein
MASAHAWRKNDTHLLKGDRSPILPDRAFLWASYLTQRRKGAKTQRIKKVCLSKVKNLAQRPQRLWGKDWLAKQPNLSILASWRDKKSGSLGIRGVWGET